MTIFCHKGSVAAPAGSQIKETLKSGALKPGEPFQAMWLTLLSLRETEAETEPAPALPAGLYDCGCCPAMLGVAGGVTTLAADLGCSTEQHPTASGLCHLAPGSA